MSDATHAARKPRPPAVSVSLSPLRGPRQPPPHVGCLSESSASLCAYFCSSLFIVYLNKWIFTRLPHPVLVSWLQQLTAFVTHGGMWGLSWRVGWMPEAFRFARPTMRTAFASLPLSVAFLGMVALSNLALQHAQVSTYQVSRSLTLIFTILLSYIFLGQRQSLQVLAASGVIVCGFAVVAADARALSLAGAVLGGCSSIFQAAYNVLIKGTLPQVNDDHMSLLMHTTSWACLLFAPAALLFDGTGAFVRVFRNADHEVWLVLASGIAAYALNLASYWCVRMTSPVTFNITGLAKAAVQALGGIIFLGDVATIQGCAGIGLKFTGSFWYARAKWMEGRQAAEGPPEDVESVGGSPRVGSPQPEEEEPLQGQR